MAATRGHEVAVAAALLFGNSVHLSHLSSHRQLHHSASAKSRSNHPHDEFFGEAAWRRGIGLSRGLFSIVRMCYKRKERAFEAIAESVCHAVAPQASLPLRVASRGELQMRVTTSRNSNGAKHRKQQHTALVWAPAKIARTQRQYSSNRTNTQSGMACIPCSWSSALWERCCRRMQDRET